ncbi:MAG: HEPN domain-containing protein [Nitrososphaerales archaeon]
MKASLRLADRSLEGARALLDRGEYFGAVSRAYYAIFHAARAMLYTYGIATKTHSGLVSLFGEHIIRKGIMPGDFAEILAKALDMRQKSDYEVFTEFREEEVKKLIADAENFVGSVKQVLKTRLK